MKDLYGIFGVGGFAREVMPVALDACAVGYGNYELAFVVEDLEKCGIVNGYHVIGDTDFLKRGKYFNIAIADYKVRERIAEKMIAVSIHPFSIVALNACVNTLGCRDDSIGEGAIICPFTVISPDAKIGRFFHANLYSYVAHDCTIGDFVTFAPGVHCNGRVTIQNYAYIGSGAEIRQGLTIGRGAVVGMGAVVTKDVAPYVTVIGNPARPMKSNRVAGTESPTRAAYRLKQDRET